VLAVEYMDKGSVNRKVKVSFTIQNSDIKIPRGSVIEIGGIDLLNKGLLIRMNSDLSKGYYKQGEAIQGIVAVDMVSQLKEYAEIFKTRYFSANLIAFSKLMRSPF